MCIPQKILLNTATIISEVNLTAINSLQREKHRITCHYSAELQTTKESLTTFQNSIEFTYRYFSCHLKVYRYKLALINRPWNCKKAKRLTITDSF